MKKLLSLILAFVMIATLSVPVFAADNIVNYDEGKNSQSSGVDVTYTVAPTFSVTIPASVTLNNDVTISASDVVVEYGKAVNVKIAGTSEEDDTFKLRTKEGAVITYTVKNGDAEVFVGDTVLSVTPISNETSVKLTFVEPENYIYAGVYEGTVTFTIVVE